MIFSISKKSALSLTLLNSTSKLALEAAAFQQHRLVQLLQVLVQLGFVIEFGKDVDYVVA